MADSISTKATIVAKAYMICGSEDTYFIEDKMPDKKQIEFIKWILDYTLTEPSIGDFDFAQDTGKYLKPGELNEFFKKNSFEKLESLKTQLQDLEKTKSDLKILRDKKIEKAHADKKVRATVERYWKMTFAITKELEKQFNLKSADTGVSCD